MASRVAQTCALRTTDDADLAGGVARRAVAHRFTSDNGHAPCVRPPIADGAVAYLRDVSSMQTHATIGDDTMRWRGNADTSTDATQASVPDVEHIICFTPGTMILTSHGDRPIEDLQPGDLVVTRDQGLRPIRWIGTRTVNGTDHHAPVRIGANALDSVRNGVLVSPHHRILYTGYRAELLFGEAEVFVAAKDLIDGLDVVQHPCDEITYIHLMFDHHQVIYADGIASESFHPCDKSLSAVAPQDREHLFALFPELRSAPGHHLDPARPFLQKHEAALLIDADDTFYV